MHIARLATLLIAAALLLGACADEDPPDWLVERATPSTTTTTVTDATPPPTTAGDPGRELAVIDLEPGVCIEDASAFTGSQVNEITQTRAIACRIPHQAEVYLRTDLPAGPDAEFPGVGELRTQAQARCREGFEEFVGVRWTSSELEIAALWPSPTSWVEGDRVVVCAVFRLDGQPLTGSARGSAI